MKIKFKHQAFQTAAVESVVDCFAGQPKQRGLNYRIDPGTGEKGGQQSFLDSGFKNADLILPPQQLLENIRTVERRQNLSQSSELIPSKASKLNLDIEMETGTGKTYCYIKSMFELNKQYGWSKFIIVVPSIAIREGVYKSLEITAEHFKEDYGKGARFFIYNSKQLHNLESFSSDAGINVMVINVQAFAARGKDQRRIYEELDDFQSRRPIDVIKANQPILIIDEPQKVGKKGTKSDASLSEFNALFTLRYSATHADHYNKIHRLDALDAYNQKLVKKIAVRGIDVKGLSGTNAYLFLDSVAIFKNRKPEARLEFEVKQKNGIVRKLRIVKHGDNLFDLSGGLEEYDGFVISEIDAHTDTVSFTNGEEITAGFATRDLSEAMKRRIQIRDAVKVHFEKEKALFDRGIKVLSLFFIDEVAKYRVYDEAGEQAGGEYARVFEEEYNERLNEVLELETDDNAAYQSYLNAIRTERTHAGYFSIDKKSRQLIDPKVASRGELAGQSEDIAAYDLILKDKERLLSFEEPVRFIFSHSALREGWDNPNVFVICTLKHSDNTTSRRQEVGRGLRLAVNQNGERQDDPATVHDINVLTVVASESYKDFVKGLQKDISDTLSDRPSMADVEFFQGKVITTEDGGQLEVTLLMAKQIHRYLVKNDYTDFDDQITQAYHDARKNGTVADLPEELKAHADQVLLLIDSVFNPSQLPQIDDGRAVKTNPVNDNLDRKEFLDLWDRINQKAIYTVHFDSDELVGKCVKTLEKELKVTPLQYTVQAGEQTETTTSEALKKGEGFVVKEVKTEKYRGSVGSFVKYDLIGNLAEACKLKRETIAKILTEISVAVFGLYKMNPENFLRETARLINEQKATMIIEKLSYDPIGEKWDIDIFTQEKREESFSKAVKADRHVFDYVFTDSDTEKKFVRELDKDSDVVVYAKLPNAFLIPTPVGNYNPDWAIAFREGDVKHVFFVAETKGSMSTMELRGLELSKVECARKFFAGIATDKVTYDVVTDYGKLMEIVKG